MFLIIGTLVVIGSVVAGFVMDGGKLLALWHPTEVIIIIGAALGSFIISNPIKVVKDSFANSLALLKGPRYGRAENGAGPAPDRAFRHQCARPALDLRAG